MASTLWSIGFVVNFLFFSSICLANPRRTIRSVQTDEELQAAGKLADDTVRDFYKFTENGQTRKTEFPSTIIPVLNQNISGIQQYYMSSSDDATWRQKIFAFGTKLQEVYQAIKTEVEQQNLNLDTTAKHRDLYNTFNDAVQTNITDADNPSYNENFTDNTQDEKYLTDEAFVQRRLASECPFAIRKVMNDDNKGMDYDELEDLMSTSFDFNATIYDAIGENITEAVDEGNLFVLHHKVYDTITTDNAGRSESSEATTSPIVYFVKNSTDHLVLLAIQEDAVNTANVLTPSSDLTEWQRLKAKVEMVNREVCSAYYAFGKLKTSSNIYCISFRRHFGPNHPLHTVMKHHCEGTIPTVSLTYTQMLSDPTQEDLSVYSSGKSGFQGMAEKAYTDLSYDKLDPSKVVENSGINPGDLAYYPYLDDSTKIYEILDDLATDIVDIAYANDQAVVNDQVLAYFTNEMSNRITNFPATFSTKLEVQKCLSKFFGLLVEQCVSTYASAPYGMFVPRTPPRLFHRGANPTLESSLPGVDETLRTMQLNALQGNFRVNKMLDYHSQITDIPLKTKVQNAYNKLQDHATDTLQPRNAARKANGELTMQHLEPNYSTNSIAI